jgi:hypothetical protein
MSGVWGAAMRKRLMNFVALASAIFCAGMFVLWGRSYWRSDWVGWSKTAVQMPVKVRTGWIYSGGGGVQVGFGSERIYIPPGTTTPRGWQYKSQKSPIAPQALEMELGWRKSMMQFGVSHDWSTPNGLSMLAGLPGVGQMFVPAPVGWTEWSWAIWVPHWFLVLLFGVLAGRWIYPWARSRRWRNRGLCSGCGYDLRGSGEQCPECGRINSKLTGETPVLRQSS